MCDNFFSLFLSRQMIDLQIDATAQREDADFYFNESRDMVTVIRKMLEAGECILVYIYTILLLLLVFLSVRPLLLLLL